MLQAVRQRLVGQDCILPLGSQIENLRHRARRRRAVGPM